MRCCSATVLRVRRVTIVTSQISSAMCSRLCYGFTILPVCTHTLIYTLTLIYTHTRIYLYAPIHVYTHLHLYTHLHFVELKKNFVSLVYCLWSLKGVAAMCP